MSELEQPTFMCEQCGGGRLHRQSVRSALWHGDRLVVVEDIPAMVCDDCHEQFFDDTTVLLLDRLRGEGFPEALANREIVAQVFSLGAAMPKAKGGGKT